MPKEMPPGLAEAIAASPPMRAPSDKLEEAQALGREFHDLEQEIAAAEEALGEKKKERHRLVHTKLPDLLDELRLDHLGLADVAMDLRSKNWYKANISAEWDTERQERAFRWLEENGFGSLVKHEVTFSFRRGEEYKAGWLVDLVTRATQLRAERLEKVARDEGRDMKPEETWDMPAATVRKTVPHATLTALVRQQSELPEGDPAKKKLPLDVLGAVVGRIVELKPRVKS